MKYIQLFEKFKKGRKKVHLLSGVVLIVEDRILLVNARKHKSHGEKWSIPKGHIEGTSSLMSALKELREEAGIKLDDNYDDTFQFKYRKGGYSKLMDVYVYRRSKEEFEKYLKGWNISKKYIDTKEIHEASFLKINKARIKIDNVMSKLLKVVGI